MKIWITIMVFIILGVNWIIIHDHNQHKDEIVGRTYEGRVYLVEQEYEDFKKFLADNPSVRINKLDALSSPNALIDMKLYAPTPIKVPYDVKVTEHYRSTSKGLIGNIVIVCVFGIVIIAGGIYIGDQFCTIIKDTKEES